jgi:hypothetical protein
MTEAPAVTCLLFVVTAFVGREAADWRTDSIEKVLML